MKYVDEFVLTVKKDKIEKYQKLAEAASKIWKKHGALEYVECVGEDMDPEIHNEECKTLTFPEMDKSNEDEFVVFAFITYRSREHRDKVNKKVMEDPEMKDEGKEMPFDFKKMAWGGFKTIVENGGKNKNE